MLVRIVLRVIIFNIAYRRCYASFHSRRRVRHSTRLQSPICPPSPPSSSVCRCWPSGHITQYTFQNWNGDCGVSIGNIASVLNALGLSPLLSGLAAAQEDSAGLMLEERNLPQRVRSKKKSAGQWLESAAPLIQLTYIVKYIHFTINECHFH